MRKVFIDCGCREGDATAVFLGDEEVGGGMYAQLFMPRKDADEYELIAFESADSRFLPELRERFKRWNFKLLERLVWVRDGVAEFNTDGESDICSLVEALGRLDALPVKSLPCLDFSAYLKKNFTRRDYLVVKMDIEGAEYAVLEKLIEDRTIRLIKELYVEYHRVGDWEINKDRIEALLQTIPRFYYRNDWP